MNTQRIALAVALLAALALAACAAPITSQPPAQTAPSGSQTQESSPTAQAGLSGTSWTLTDLNGTAPIADQAPTLAFDAEGQAAGTAGCNRYFGSYTADGASITFGQLGSTMMACAPEVMQQETAFLQLMGDVASFAVAGGTLTLTTGAGETLVFAQA